MTHTVPLSIPMDRQRWRPLARVLQLFGIFALATVLGDVLAGSQLLTAAGASLGAGAVDPVLNSQIHYLGAMWAGVGASLWWCARDLRSRAGLLQLLMAAVIVGGVGRVIAAVRYGSGPPMLAFFIAVELLAAPAIVFWHRRLLRD